MSLNRPISEIPSTVSVRGRTDRVQGEFRLGGRQYLALEKIGGPGRDTWRVFDWHAGPEGDFRVLHRLEKSPATTQRIEVLRRVAEGNLHLPKIVDFHQDENHVWVVQTWVWGTPLENYLEQVRAGRVPRPSVYQATRLVRQLAHGVANLHVKASVVHGDIKPANLIVTRDPYLLVLVDFGSAWPVEQTAQRDPGDGHSAPYAAPEQWSGKAAVNFRADVFSLSVVWHELLTLDIPYGGLGGVAGADEYEMASNHRLTPVQSRCSGRESIPGQAWRLLEANLARGLALSPDGRFASRREWLDAMDQLYRWLHHGSAGPQTKNWLARGMAWLQRGFPTGSRNASSDE